MSAWAGDFTSQNDRRTARPAAQFTVKGNPRAPQLRVDRPLHLRWLKYISANIPAPATATAAMTTISSPVIQPKITRGPQCFDYRVRRKLGARRRMGLTVPQLFAATISAAGQPRRPDLRVRFHQYSDALDCYCGQYREPNEVAIFERIAADERKQRGLQEIVSEDHGYRGA